MLVLVKSKNERLQDKTYTIKFINMCYECLMSNEYAILNSIQDNISITYLSKEPARCMLLLQELQMQSMQLLVPAYLNQECA